MAKPDEHFKQAERNFQFLSTINQQSPANIDWQVTVCFYTALHVINGHIAHKELNYRSHKDVLTAIFSGNQTSLMRVPEPVYLAYHKLFELSRRARYLVFGTDKDNNSSGPIVTPAQYIFDVHQAKAIRHLCVILDWARVTYNIQITPIRFICKDFNPQKEGFGFVLQ